MASTKANGAKVLWTYTDDLGTDWAVAAKACYVSDGTDGAKYGGTSPAVGTPSIPNGMKMRKVKLVSDTPGQHVYVPVYQVGAALWTTPNTSVTRDIGGVDVAMFATSTRRGEKQERKGKDPVHSS